MRCFPLPNQSSRSVSSARLTTECSLEQHPISRWIEQTQNDELGITDSQADALARLIPLLLCGEQSAVHIFNTEQLRLDRQLACHDHEQRCDDPHYIALQTLARIEADERLHEQALQLVLNKLPTTSEQHKIKRKAQRFYTQITQNTHSIAEHFQMIAKLDSCVCILMDSVAKSSLRDTHLASLFNLIKKDEARHVGFAKKHSRIVRPKSVADDSCSTFKVQAQLVELLATESASLNALQINSQALFERLLKASD